MTDAPSQLKIARSLSRWAGFPSKQNITHLGRKRLLLRSAVRSEIARERNDSKYVLADYERHALVVGLKSGLPSLAQSRNARGVNDGQLALSHGKNRAVGPASRLRTIIRDD